MGKQKFYVVWKGNNPGVYQSWEKCQNEIKNVNGALFKSFSSLEEAKKAYDQGYEEYKQSLDYKNVLDGPELNSISVDAASSGNPGLMEYQGVDTNTKEILFKMGPFNNATNNIGEFLALVHGIAVLEKKSEIAAEISEKISGRKLTISTNQLLQEESLDRLQLRCDALKSALPWLLASVEAFPSTFACLLHETLVLSPVLTGQYFHDVVLHL